MHLSGAFVYPFGTLTNQHFQWSSRKIYSHHQQSVGLVGHSHLRLLFLCFALGLALKHWCSDLDFWHSFVLDCGDVFLLRSLVVDELLDSCPIILTLFWKSYVFLAPLFEVQDQQNLQHLKQTNEDLSWNVSIMLVLILGAPRHFEIQKRHLLP